MTLRKKPGGNHISANEIRQLFNEIICPQVIQGELVARVQQDKHPSRTKAKEPFCTRSQLVAYYDAQGMEIARAHQYRRPDGTLGASGKPDPKRIFVNGICYSLEIERKSS